MQTKSAITLVIVEFYLFGRILPLNTSHEHARSDMIQKEIQI